MTEHHIRYEKAGGIGVITIDRPEKRNAMTYAMLGAFIEAVRQAGDDERVRVLIVTGAGGAFCAGTDLADLATVPGETRGVRGRAEERGVWWPITACPKPVIGAVDGYAVGMGAEFTSQCDVRIVTDRARFAWNFAQRGLVPDTGAGSWLLPRLIGPSAAAEIGFTGRMVDAEEAERLGLLNRVTGPDDLLDQTLAMAGQICANSPGGVRMSKRALQANMEVASFAAALELENRGQALLTRCDDMTEALEAFKAKRAPNFAGR
jgi:enoyl-CoA hydratase/carnithine racemase